MARAAKLKARWLEEERAIRNEAPIRRAGKEGSRRRSRRTCPKDASFCFGGRPAAPMLALVVRWARDRAALAHPLPAPNRGQAAAAGAARRDSVGWVVRPSHSSSSPSAAFVAVRFASAPGKSLPGARIATLPQYRSAGHFSAHLMPDRPCVVRLRTDVHAARLFPHCAEFIIGPARGRAPWLPSRHGATMRGEHQHTR